MESGKDLRPYGCGYPVPVKPGRNLAVILEVAAMNHRQKKMGYNAATELLDQLGLDMESKEVVKDYDAF